MKSISFVVTLTLSDHIVGDDDEIYEMANKIARALTEKQQSPTVDGGLTPDGCDEGITCISVSHSGIEIAETHLC